MPERVSSPSRRTLAFLTRRDISSHNVHMNEARITERRIIHAFDAGAPEALAAAGLAARFHGWRGLSGRRYLTTVHRAESAPAYAGAVIVLARREDDGTRVALWAGRSPASAEALARLARRKGAAEVHIHLIAEAEDARAAVAADLASRITAPALAPS